MNSANAVYTLWKMQQKSVKQNWASHESNRSERSEYIVVNTKKWIFYTVIESSLSYGWEVWTLDYKLKKIFSIQKWIFGEELRGTPDY